MSEERLDAVQITNFRSIGGPVSIPLDAPIVLLHGTNGAGKSTVMAALELALTGGLSAVDQPDLEHLIHYGRDEAKVELVSSRGRSEVILRDRVLIGNPLLELEDAQFFVERCYLQQRTLSRLLEIYQGDGTGDSQLTRFVNDLLGLDELESLLEGTHDLTDKRLFRHLVPEYAELESERDSLAGALERLREQPENSGVLTDHLAPVLAELGMSTASADDEVEPLLRRQSRDGELVELAARRREVLAIQTQLKTLEHAPESKELERLEETARNARKATDDWRKTHGQALEDVLAPLRSRFPSLPDAATAEDPAAVRATAVAEVSTVLARLSDALTRDASARADLDRVDDALLNANERLVAIDTQLAEGGPTTDTEELAKLLAALVPHVHSDDCPVCGRRFGEVSDQPLIAHLAARISSLSEHAERLSTLARARLQATNDLAALREERAGLEQRLLSEEERAKSETELSSLKLVEDRLRELEDGVAVGADLTRTLTEAERQLVHASERSRLFADLVSTVRALATATGKSEPADRIEETLDALVHDVEAQISRVERLERLRLDALKHLRESREHRQRQRALDSELAATQARELEINEKIRVFDERREELWSLRRTAETARNDIVRRVFNDALNSVWRDLFVRLAPEESFVPIFRVPDTRRNRLVAELATIYRDSDEEAGSPGTMLSAGNLNTAALTLFLALHLSVSPRLPWLLLDDPIQSMDEVHVQQFAALLRTLAKRLDRRIVIAVHERALFEYLSLELSAAQPDDVLITIELSRSRDGTTVVRPSRLGYVPDRAFTPTEAQPV